MSDIDTIVDGLWKKYDADQSGTLNLDDTLPFFEVMIANRPDLGLQPGNFMEWFDKIDSDHDGTISKDELKGYLAGINYSHTHE